MIDFFKNLIAERLVIKIVGFIFAIGIIPVLILLYGLDKEPDWVSKKEHYLKHSYALTVNAPSKLFNLQESKVELKKIAQKEFKQEIFNRALKQIKLSYEWNTLEGKVQELLLQTLKEELNKIDFKKIKEQSIYEDTLDFLIYGLYSMESANIDVILQKIYTVVNLRMSELY